MQGLSVPVVYALKQNAKRAKSALEEARCLDKNYRMVPSETHSNAIAIPVIESFVMSSDQELLLMGQGLQICPLSTKVMGNQVGSNRKLPSNLTRVQQAILLTVEALSSHALDFNDEKVIQSVVKKVNDLDLTFWSRSLRTIVRLSFLPGPLKDFKKIQCVPEFRHYESVSMTKQALVPVLIRLRSGSLC